jgi:hypothetical protein
MAKEDNLTSWKKGQSGNINGRPKGSLNRSTIAKKWLTTDQEYKNPLTQDLENLSQDYIRTAVAKGISEKRVIWSHAIRNSVIPIAANFGQIIGVVIEIFFWKYSHSN